MVFECTRWAPKETGGILLGYSAEDSVVVTHVIGPGPKAKHTLYSFTPDPEWHESEISRIYKDSGRINNYLGDWHSHPKGSNLLSNKDKRVMANIAAYPPARQPYPIMAIVHDMGFWSMTIWCLDTSGQHVSVELRCC